MPTRNKSRLFLIIILCAFMLAGNAYSVTRESLMSWGDETLDMLKSRYRLSSGLYAGAPGQTSATYAWGHGILLSAVVGAARVDNSYLAEAENLADLIHSNFWCSSGGGYNASRGGCGDRYSDDSAWIVLAMLELYEINGNVKYLNNAINCTNYIMTCENDLATAPGGGIRWHESNTCGTRMCSTAPVILCNIMLYQATGQSVYLDNTLRLYNWCNAYGMRDSLGIYYEGTKDGCSIIDYVQLGYDTAPILQAVIRLYQATGDEQYLTEAQRVAHAMVSRFVKADTHYLKANGKWCGHNMTDALVDLYEVDGDQYWLDVAAGYLEYLRNNCLFDGLYSEYWDDTTAPGSTDIIDHAAVARSFWTLARTNGGIAPNYPVILFENCSYGGLSLGLWHGDYDLAELTSRGIKNDSVSAIKINGGYSVTLYDNSGYTGTSQTRTSSISCLDSSVNDKLSSVKIGHSCPPADMIAFVSINGVWQEQSDIDVVVGDALALCPLPDTGTWLWTGPNGFGSTDQQIEFDAVSTAMAGNYIARNTNTCGTVSEITFSVTVSNPVSMPIIRSNLALNKLATADAYISSEPPQMAVDGTVSGNSKWCIATSGSHWLRVDLGDYYWVDTFVVRHSGAGGESTSWNTKNYSIQVSDNGISNWRNVVVVQNNIHSVTRSVSAPVYARYVRLYVTTPTQNTNTAVRIYEFEVYGSYDSHCYAGDVAGSGTLPDCRVDLRDFQVIANDWLTCNNPQDSASAGYWSEHGISPIPSDCAAVNALDLAMAGDLNGDCYVNMADLTIIAGNWLFGIEQQWDTLYGHWTLDDASGTVATDSSVYANNGTVFGDPARSLGRVGNCFTFDGIDDYVVIPDCRGIAGSNPRTVSAFIKADVDIDNSERNLHCIVSWGRSLNSGYAKWFVSLDDVTGKLALGIYGARLLGGVSLEDGTWHHIAVVLPDGADNINQVKMYVDGIEVETNAIGLDARLSTQLSEVYIGLVNSTPEPGAFAPAQFFKGSIDEVMIYSRALTAQEIYELAN
ncbi:MAG: discoidin domain-containing protein [Sedimentisphaerales bacterium]|nr:discoidin domain-containing protein [Sedimentisphaerales bacterium]